MHFSDTDCSMQFYKQFKIHVNVLDVDMPHGNGCFFYIEVQAACIQKSADRGQT